MLGNWAQCFCLPISNVGGGDGGDVVWAVWACPCLGRLVFFPQAACEGNGVWCAGKPWPACQEAAHRTKWAQTKQARGRRAGGGGLQFHSCYPYTPVLLSGMTLSGREHPRHTRLSDWAVLRCCGWHPGRLGRRNVKCCISLHALPSLVSGKDGNPIISHA